MKATVVIPNWNGEDYLRACLDSLMRQTVKVDVIVVDNGSVDRSLGILNDYANKQLVVLRQRVNHGFAGGVNIGIRHALELDSDYILLFNNDAEADSRWAEKLILSAEKYTQAGIVTSKFLRIGTNKLDSTGDFYTTFGLPFPRGRDEEDRQQYDTDNFVFGASGGASLYKATMLKEIGLFDENFFAYFEDVDISFRAQLSGWKVYYEPGAIAYHHVSATSSKLGYFAVYQTAKNFPLLFLKNMPARLLFKYAPLALYWYVRMYGARMVRGGGWAYTKGFLKSMLLLPEAFSDRRRILRNMKVSVKYVDTILYHHRPPILGERFISVGQERNKQ